MRSTGDIPFAVSARASTTVFAADRECPVNSYNEWDPLEEVVVGRIEESIFPQQAPYLLGGVPTDLYKLLRFLGGFKRRPERWFVKPAQAQMDAFIHLLESEGVTVRRPAAVKHSKTFSTPHWKSKGHTTACPRDCFLVIGNEILESAMSWRCRYFEPHGYYGLFKEYFDRGARWTAAPKPPLLDSLYVRHYTVPEQDESLRYIINESEVVFDAADFARCGRDLFVTRSNVTNLAGIAWVRRHLGADYRIHHIDTLSRQPMHIDTTFVPLGPGKALINPKYLDRRQLPSILKGWDILDAPQPDPVTGGVFNEVGSMCSTWLNMNVLMLDEERVVVESSQPSMIRLLKELGLKPIPCDLTFLGPFGGSFHCITLDIRRRGTLQSYF